MKEIPTRDRIMALLSPPSRGVYLTVEDARWIKDEIEQLQDALRPFSKAHQSADPYTCISLRDLRVAFNTMQIVGDDSTPQTTKNSVRDASCLDAGCDIDGIEPHKPHCDHAESDKGNDEPV